VQFLVNHLHSHAVTELELSHVRFSNDGFNVFGVTFRNNVDFDQNPPFQLLFRATTRAYLAASGSHSNKQCIRDNGLDNRTMYFPCWESTKLKVLKCGFWRMSMRRELLNHLETAQRFAAALANNIFTTTLDMDDTTVSSAVAGQIIHGLAYNTTLKNLVLGEIEQGGDLQPIMERLAAVRGLKRLTLTGWEAWDLLLQQRQSLYDRHSTKILVSRSFLDLIYRGTRTIVVKSLKSMAFWSAIAACVWLRLFQAWHLVHGNGATGT
jgi:hypothetical protein